MGNTLLLKLAQKLTNNSSDVNNGITAIVGEVLLKTHQSLTFDGMSSRLDLGTDEGVSFNAVP